MRRNDIIFNKCSIIFNLILYLLIFLFKNDKLFILFYLPEQSKKFISQNTTL